MKGRNGKRIKISTFIVIATTLTLFLISMQMVLADAQFDVSFLPYIPNRPPTIHNEFPTNDSTNVSLKVICQIQVSDPDNDLMNISWYENSTGSWAPGKPYSSVVGGTYHWAYLQATSYSTTYYWMIIVDDGSHVTTATYHFTTKPMPYTPPPSPPSPTPNKSPIAKITGPNNAYANETLVFYADKSYDPDGNITGYRWDFNNDGVFDTDWIKDTLITHSYSRPGNYTIILQVKDDDGAIATTSHIINITLLQHPLQLPIPRINGPYYGYTNESITFNSTGSYDPDGTIINYTWYFGDGNISYMQNPVYVYSKLGNYTIILKVTDNDNLSNLTTTKAIILDREIKKPEKERELPLTFLLVLIIAIIIAIVLALLILPRGYQITVLIEKDTSNKNEEENIKSKVDKILSESDENKETK